MQIGPSGHGQCAIVPDVHLDDQIIDFFAEVIQFLNANERNRQVRIASFRATASQDRRAIFYSLVECIFYAPRSAIKPTARFCSV